MKLRTFGVNVSAIGACPDVARHVPDESARHMRLFAWISQTSSGLRSVHARDFLVAGYDSPTGPNGYSRDRFAAAACSGAQLDGCAGESRSRRMGLRFQALAIT